MASSTSAAVGRAAGSGVSIGGVIHESQGTLPWKTTRVTWRRSSTSCPAATALMSTHPNSKTALVADGRESILREMLDECERRCAPALQNAPHAQRGHLGGSGSPRKGASFLRDLSARGADTCGGWLQVVSVLVAAGAGTADLPERRCYCSIAALEYCVMSKMLRLI